MNGKGHAKTTGLIFGLPDHPAVDLARKVLVCQVDQVEVASQAKKLLPAAQKGNKLVVAILAVGVSSRPDPSGQLSLDSDLAAIDVICQHFPHCQFVLLINSRASLQQCCQAVSQGAGAIVSVDDQQFEQQLEQSLDQAIDQYEQNCNDADQAKHKEMFSLAGIASQSPSMAKVLGQARKAARISEAPIIIEGQSGTGKQLLAEAIHRMDPKRSKKPFLSVNCAAITGTLAESALFGHRKGAFTGATEDRLGYFRAAAGGTILLDEITELDKSLQPKLLRVLQEGKVMPVGDDREYQCDVRVITASNSSLSDEVQQGRFRLDLYQRLNVIHLHLPSLRQRLEDIPLLFAYFLEKYASYYPYAITDVDRNVYKVLQQCLGKGNIRELENIVRQILIFKTAGQQITLADLPPALVKTASGQGDDPDMLDDQLAENIQRIINSGNISLPKLLASYESLILRTAIDKLGLRGGQLAEHLGLNRRTLYNKLQRHGLGRI